LSYTPDWEPLAAALERVRRAGVATEHEAKIDLCRAVGDRKIAVPVWVAADDPGMGGRDFSGSNVDAPKHLNPDDFDWTLSRPLNQLKKKWKIGPHGPESYTWPGGWEARTIDLIELSTTQVKAILCGPHEPIQPAHGERRPALGGPQGVTSEQGANSGGIERPGTENTGPAAPKKSRRGPAPNTVDRYGESDRGLFNELERIQRDGGTSLTAAANELAEAGRVEGVGTPKSRGARLVRRYNRERGHGN
jgi:hypothetical protein